MYFRMFHRSLCSLLQSLALLPLSVSPSQAALSEKAKNVHYEASPLAGDMSA